MSYLVHSWAFRYIWAILTFGTFLGHLDPECPKCEWECKSPTSSHSALQIGRKRERLSGACAGALANWGHCHPVNVNIDVNLNENEKGFPRVTLNVIESGTSSIEETLNARHHHHHQGDGRPAYIRSDQLQDESVPTIQNILPQSTEQDN